MKIVVTGRVGSRADEALDYLNLYSRVQMEPMSLQQACSTKSEISIVIIDTPTLTCLHQHYKVIDLLAKEAVELEDFYIRLLTESYSPSIIKDDGSLDLLKVKLKKYLNSSQLYKKKD